MKFIIFFVILLLQSCTLLTFSEKFKELKKNELPLNGKLRLDGYYYFERLADYTNHNGVKSMLTNILYSNGVLDHNNVGAADYGANGFRLKYNNYEYVHKKFNKILKKKPYNNNNYSDWGIYRINGDSIKIQFYLQALSPFWKYDLIEKKGTILNDTTFLLTEYIDYVEPQKNKNINELYKFRKLDAKPDSICWINEE